MRSKLLGRGSALCGGVIGVSSASFAIATVGGSPQYDTRIVFGWAALALAAAATFGGLEVHASTAVWRAVTVLASLLGAAAISLFYINTYYWAAVPFWILAALLRRAP
ncbi:MAG TPA: hypothetical protein VGQ62_06215 [Chloroflexota bacterium]|jgi:hypothetical protein|nr:hypothetical protein [Chloroflexota bacterium]